MKTEKITIHDIAKELNIASSTVSRALNNHPKISKATKEKVFLAAERLGYKTNIVKLNMVSQNKVIALILPEIKTLYSQLLIETIQKLADIEDFSLILLPTSEKFESELKYAKLLENMRISGLIVSLSLESKNANHFNSFLEKKIPIILLDRVDYDFSALKIVTDNFSAAYKVVEHLVINNYNKIAFLAGPPELLKYAEMIKGYKSALAANGIVFTQKHLIASDLTEEDVKVIMNRLLNLKEIPDAIFIADAKASTQVLKILKENLIKVPEEIGLVSLGFDYSHKFIEPSITTIEQSAESLARLAFKQLHNLIVAKKKNTNGTLIKPSKLLIRNSSLSS